MLIQFMIVESQYHGRYGKDVELDEVPQVGHLFAVENEKGRGIFKVKEVVWEEGKKPYATAISIGVAASSFGNFLLRAGGWENL